MKQKKELSPLQLCPLFSGLSDEEIQHALSFYDAQKRTFAKGEFVLRSGQEVARFYLLLSGAVQIMMDDIDGRQMIMTTVSPGQTFAESLCYQRAAESPVYAIALEPSEALALSADNLKGDALPDSLQNQRLFIRMLSMKTLSMNDRIQVLSKPTLREKLMTLFAQYVAREGKTFNLPLDRNSMAAYLGVNRSALSRELSRMKSEGIIDFYKNSFTVHPDKSIT